MVINYSYGIRMIIFEAAIFCYYFQVPFEGLSPAITFFLGLFLLLDLKTILKNITMNIDIASLYFFIFVLLLLNLAWSVYCGTNLNGALRFLMILIAIPLCFWCDNTYDDKMFKIFKILSACKAIMLLALGIMLIIEGDHTIIRFWANSNGYGDIYLTTNNIPKVQIHGNALLVIAFMVDFYQERKFGLYNIVILLAIVVAGNFAFKLGIMLFFVWLLLKKLDLNKITIRKMLAILILMIFTGWFIQYTEEEAENKSGYNSSNAVRLVQYDVFTDTNAFIGSGLGVAVKDVRLTKGSLDKQYYELQTLYIYYQVGLIVLLLYYLLLLVLIKRQYIHDAQVIICIYFIYSFFNPYCFDTTEMIVIILLSLFEEQKCISQCST